MKKEVSSVDEYLVPTAFGEDEFVEKKSGYGLWKQRRRPWRGSRK